MAKKRAGVLGRGLSGRQLSSVIGVVFGLVYVEANAAAVGEPGSLALRVVAGAAFAAGLVLLRRGLHHHSVTPRESPQFGTGYWLVVGGEAAALLAGRYLLAGPLGRPAAVLPWVTLVVGVHFFALGLVLRARIQHLLGALLTTCGAVGLALVLGGAPARSVVGAAGIGPGIILLAFGLAGLAVGARGPDSPPDVGGSANTTTRARAEPAIARASGREDGG